MRELDFLEDKSAINKPERQYSMIRTTHILRSILMLCHKRQILPWRKALEPQNINLVIRLNLIIICRVHKRQRQHALLLQVRLVDTRKRADNDSEATEIAWLERGVLTGGTFAVVMVADDDPFDAVVTVVRSYLGNASPFAGNLILDAVGFSVGSIDGANEAIF